MTVELPSILKIPPKLLPMITESAGKKYILLEGGRGSGKSHSVARWILYLCEHHCLRVVCGRETQNSIEESVYTIFCDLIREYNLNFTIQSNKLIHNKTQSTISFKGFREQGAINIKGLEGVNILWIDESQAISKTSLDIIIPTIRADHAKIIFTMNRLHREDPVYVFLAERDDCLSIHIDYFENPFCPLTLKIEAENCRRQSESEYRHIWLGQPLDRATNSLFSSDKLTKAQSVETWGDYPIKQTVVGIDFAAQGGDMCVASILERRSNVHWECVEQIAWDEPEPTVSIGKIASILGSVRPDVACLDVGGMGYVVYSRLRELGVDIQPFDGATTQGVATTHYGNARAEGYFLLNEWFNQEYLLVKKENKKLFSQLETIKYKYRSNGQRIIVSKDEMRKDGLKSPDYADSLMMAVWGAVKYLGNSSTNRVNSGKIQRISGNSSRKRM